MLLIKPMKLLIVESPAKAKTISKYLDGKYTVKASVGHIRDLPKSNKKAIDIEAGFVPHYEISKGKEKVVAEIQELAKEADEILLATDPDREGEAIAWHIAQATHLRKPKRVVFHEITKEAVQEAILHPRAIDDNLKQAQEARRVLDRLVGYDLSGLIWKKVRYGLSAGRVQSPALRILVEREREIKAFVPETFWVITADTETNPATGSGRKPEKLTLTCDEEPRDKKLVDKILELGNKNDWSVKDVKETEVKRSPKAPFTTSTLQQAASSRLGFAPSRTMGIAQKLYEQGFITYMRTDSTNLSQQALGQISTLVKKEYGEQYFEAHTYATKSKNAQEAHEAIRPTNAAKMSAGHTDEQKRLYKLIWQRAVASQMADAKTLRTKITATFSDEVPAFSANGSRILFDGWLKADPEARQDDVELPKVAAGEKLKLLDLRTQEKQTEPPPRYSEAGLVKELEKRGIGRPSTYASIIKTIVDRGYVEKIDRALKPTDTGEVVSTFLEKNFMEYINDSFTAEMEDKLDDIANGEKEYVKVLKDFYGPFLKDVKAKSKSAEKLTDLGPVDAQFLCPICNSPMVWKLSKNGKFMSCSRFPECIGARTDEGKVIDKEEENKPMGNHPETGEPMYIKTGRFGPYVQLGERTDKDGKKVKPRMASIPKDKDPLTVTIPEAAKYLSLPRVLGNHPETNLPITASIGRFGPYIVMEKDFRSLKTDNVYDITLDRALEILKEPKKPRGFRKKEEKK
ncbi:MAG: topoisomerase topoisomerase protein [Candidatus Paceibacter sp.]|jgi:DNA topoisomerase-1|nr:topoisomerase topoisomerase protein [Candidatus Paceibacter sp.]